MYLQYYAGIGSRETPITALKTMEDIGYQLAQLGYVLRSGAADGADSAFEKGCDRAEGIKEIFIPWLGFNNRRKDCLYGVTEEAMQLAEQLHPAWDRCSMGARKLHARNCYQILGEYLNMPASFVVCWTHGGQLLGGTAQALRIALLNNIPIYNLGNPKFDYEDFYKNITKAGHINHVE